MSFPASVRFAQLQGERLATLAHDLLSVRDLLRLTPELEIRLDPSMPVPSASQFNAATGKWQILLNSSEPADRQDYELVYEFKRILDARDTGLLYDPSEPVGSVQQFICASYFARVALMPEIDVRRSVAHGLKSLPALAKAHDTWIEAARLRVSDLDLAGFIPID
jgi:hypothetical protein